MSWPTVLPPIISLFSGAFTLYISYTCLIELANKHIIYYPGGISWDTANKVSWDTKLNTAKKFIMIPHKSTLTTIKDSYAKKWAAIYNIITGKSGI